VWKAEHRAFIVVAPQGKRNFYIFERGAGSELQNISKCTQEKEQEADLRPQCRGSHLEFEVDVNSAR
jgi:hypothetical protein